MNRENAPDANDRLRPQTFSDRARDAAEIDASAAAGCALLVKQEEQAMLAEFDARASGPSSRPPRG